MAAVHRTAAVAVASIALFMLVSCLPDDFKPAWAREAWSRQAQPILAQRRLASVRSWAQKPQNESASDLHWSRPAKSEASRASAVEPVPYGPAPRRAVPSPAARFEAAAIIRTRCWGRSCP